MPVNNFRELLQRSDASGSRSTILKPIMWLISILIGGLFVVNQNKGPLWVIILFGISIGASVVIFFIVYFFCLLKDRDALRSETFSIQKMAIEKGLFGDNINGLLEINTSTSAEDENFTDQSENEN